jgi:accessory gene regulator protein AgrB
MVHTVSKLDTAAATAELAVTVLLLKFTSETLHNDTPLLCYLASILAFLIG